MPSPLGELRRFIVDNFLFGEDNPPLKEDESLLERGIIDSTGVLELVGFLETHFGVTVTDDEIIPGNFDSVSRLSRFVIAKLQASE